MARVAQLTLQYFGLVVKGSAGELALMVMEGATKGTRSRVLQGNSGWITFRNEAGKPTRNARCWHKIGTVGERCPGSGHYICRGISSRFTDVKTSKLTSIQDCTRPHTWGPYLKYDPRINSVFTGSRTLSLEQNWTLVDCPSSPCYVVLIVGYRTLGRHVIFWRYMIVS